MFGFKIIRKKDLEEMQGLLDAAKLETEKARQIIWDFDSVQMESEGLKSANAALQEAYNALLSENKKLRQENAMLWHDNREHAAARCASCPLKQEAEDDD